MKKALVVFGLVAAMFAASVRPSHAILDKTRFVGHLGAAFFAFHQWVYKPYKQGMFASGSPHRTKTLVKGGIALLFAAHEVKVANTIAHNSKSPLLQRLAGGLDRMESTFTSIGGRLRNGQFNPKDIPALSSVVDTVGSGAAAAGTRIRDIKVPIPGLG